MRDDHVRYVAASASEPASPDTVVIGQNVDAIEMGIERQTAAPVRRALDVGFPNDDHLYRGEEISNILDVSALGRTSSRDESDASKRLAKSEAKASTE